MSLPKKLKQAVALILSITLTVVMFPVILAATSFLLMTGFVVALFGAYRLRQLANGAERTGGFGSRTSSAEEGVTIEGSYHVVHPAN